MVTQEEYENSDEFKFKMSFPKAVILTILNLGLLAFLSIVLDGTTWYSALFIVFLLSYIVLKNVRGY
mgnify:CR=1 FL=1|tara:strand:- start:554 stop:754 length:201 start_codon:yes stop_codon:yes gene_type:complete